VRGPRELASTLWPLEQVAARYESFVERYQGLPDELDGLKRQHGRLADADFLPLALTMAVSYTECSARDPYLPPELLPRPWPGRAAREIVVRSRRLALLLREEAGRPALSRAVRHVRRDARDALGPVAQVAAMPVAWVRSMWSTRCSTSGHGKSGWAISSDTTPWTAAHKPMATR
jgi:hypothetical protein